MLINVLRPASGNFIDQQLRDALDVGYATHMAKPSKYTIKMPEGDWLLKYPVIIQGHRFKLVGNENGTTVTANGQFPAFILGRPIDDTYRKNILTPAYFPDAFGVLDSAVAPTTGVKYGFRSNADSLIHFSYTPVDMDSSNANYRWDNQAVVNIEAAIAVNNSIADNSILFGFNNYTPWSLNITANNSKYIFSFRTKNAPFTSHKYTFTRPVATTGKLDRITLAVDFNNGQVNMAIDDKPVNGVYTSVHDNSRPTDYNFVPFPGSSGLRFIENKYNHFQIGHVGTWNNQNSSLFGLRDISVYGLNIRNTSVYNFGPSGISRIDNLPMTDNNRYFKAVTNQLLSLNGKYPNIYNTQLVEATCDAGKIYGYANYLADDVKKQGVWLGATDSYEVEIEGIDIYGQIFGAGVLLCGTNYLRLKDVNIWGFQSSIGAGRYGNTWTHSIEHCYFNGFYKSAIDANTAMLNVTGKCYSAGAPSGGNIFTNYSSTFHVADLFTFASNNTDYVFDMVGDDTTVFNFERCYLDNEGGGPTKGVFNITGSNWGAITTLTLNKFDWPASNKGVSLVNYNGINKSRTYVNLIDSRVGVSNLVNISMGSGLVANFEWAQLYNKLDSITTQAPSGVGPNSVVVHLTNQDPFAFSKTWQYGTLRLDDTQTGAIMYAKQDGTIGTYQQQTATLP